MGMALSPLCQPDSWGHNPHGHGIVPTMSARQLRTLIPRGMALSPLCQPDSWGHNPHGHGIVPTMSARQLRTLKPICITSRGQALAGVDPFILYLARVIYKICLNSRNTKYPQNVTCICKNVLSVKHILLECPITTELFQKNGYDLTACNSVTDILYNTDVINHIVKWIVHSPVGKLV